MAWPGQHHGQRCPWSRRLSGRLRASLGCLLTWMRPLGGGQCSSGLPTGGVGVQGPGRQPPTPQCPGDSAPRPCHLTGPERLAIAGEPPAPVPSARPWSAPVSGISVPVFPMTLCSPLPLTVALPQREETQGREGGGQTDRDPLSLGTSPVGPGPCLEEGSLVLQRGCRGRRSRDMSPNLGRAPSLHTALSLPSGVS